jgi:hypothetical protein
VEFLPAGKRRERRFWAPPRAPRSVGCIFGCPLAWDGHSSLFWPEEEEEDKGSHQIISTTSGDERLVPGFSGYPIDNAPRSARSLEAMERARGLQRDSPIRYNNTGLCCYSECAHTSV